MSITNINNHREKIFTINNSNHPIFSPEDFFNVIPDANLHIAIQEIVNELTLRKVQHSLINVFVITALFCKAW